MQHRSGDGVEPALAGDWAAVTAQALLDEDPEPVGELLDGRRHNLVTELTASFNRLMATEEDRVDGATRSGARSAFAQELERLLVETRPYESLPTLVVSYTYLTVLDAWERTGSWSALDAALGVLDDVGLRAVVLDPHSAIAPEERSLVVGLVARARRMSSMLWTESAMNCSSAALVRHHAEAVVSQAGEAVSWHRLVGRRLRPPYDAVGRELDRSARADRAYYAAVARAAGVTETVNAWDRDGWAAVDLASELAHAVEDVESAASAPIVAASPVAASELRAHLHMLQSATQAVERPFVLAERTKVIYCFPFAVEHDGVEWDVLRGACEWRSDETAEARLEKFIAGDGGWLPFLRTQSLRITDMWPVHVDSSPDDEGLSRRDYEGIELVLPNPVVRDRPAPQRAAAEHEVEVEESVVRLTELGNHYLRMTISRDRATLHDLYQDLRRGSTEVGYEEVAVSTPDGAHRATWNRLADFARDVIARLGPALDACLRELREGEVAPPGGARRGAHRGAATPTAGTGAELVRTPRKLAESAHTILSIQTLWLVEPDGSERHATADDLLTGSPAVGQSLLFQPIRQFASSLEEWIRFPPLDWHGLNLFEGHGYSGDVAVRTLNTTVFPIVQMPNWLLIEYEELAEFVASLNAVSETRRAQLSRKKDTLRSVRERVERWQANPTEPPAREEIEAEKLEIEEIRQLASEPLTVRSSELLRTANHRQFLDRLVDASELERKQEAVRAEAERVMSHYETIASYVQVLDRRYQDRLQWRLSFALAVLTVMSVVDVFQFVHEEFSLSRWVLLPELLVFVAVLGVVIFVTYKMRPKTRSGGRGGGPAGTQP